MKKSNWINSVIALVVIVLNPLRVHAQDVSVGEDQILLSGKVNCFDPLNGTLSSVVVFNISKGYGTSSGLDGSFEIKMGRSDTILFSTAAHKDNVYFIGQDQKFEDHTIDVVMETDEIWLETVTIIGVQNLEQFRQEILLLDLPREDVNMVLPVINKYAKQTPLGAGEYDLVGPLTYLQNKFSRFHKMKKQIR